MAQADAERRTAALQRQVQSLQDQLRDAAQREALLSTAGTGASAGDTSPKAGVSRSGVAITPVTTTRTLARSASANGRSGGAAFASSPAGSGGASGAKGGKLSAAKPPFALASPPLAPPKAVGKKVVGGGGKKPVGRSVSSPRAAMSTSGCVSVVNVLSRLFFAGPLLTWRE